jgi:hypothetical protein
MCVETKSGVLLSWRNEENDSRANLIKALFEEVGWIVEPNDFKADRNIGFSRFNSCAYLHHEIGQKLDERTEKHISHTDLRSDY